jgi:hypothetical protein
MSKLNALFMNVWPDVPSGNLIFWLLSLNWMFGIISVACASCQDVTFVVAAIMNAATIAIITSVLFSTNFVVIWQIKCYLRLFRKIDSIFPSMLELFSLLHI